MNSPAIQKITKMMWPALSQRYVITSACCMCLRLAPGGSAAPAPHDAEEVLDIGDGCLLADSVPEVENVGAVSKRLENVLRLALQLGSAGEQEQRIEIALHRHPGWKLARGPQRIDCLVEADRIDAGFPRIVD